MSKVTDLAAEEAARAEAKPDPEPTPGEPEPTEPTEPTPGEPEPTPEPDEPASKGKQESPDAKMRRQFDAAVKTFYVKLCSLLEVDELDEVPIQGAIGFMLPGMISKRPHGDFRRCTTCNGWGKVLTGSLKAGEDEKDCPDPRCKGRGYWQKPVAAEPQPLTMVPMPAPTANGSDEWGEAPAWMGDPRLSTAPQMRALTVSDVALALIAACVLYALVHGWGQSVVSLCVCTMRLSPVPRFAHARPHLRPLAAVANGPVADTAEPLAAEAGRPITEPDGDDTDTVGHD